MWLSASLFSFIVQDRDSYGNEITFMARPMPIEYVLIEVSRVSSLIVHVRWRPVTNVIYSQWLIRVISYGDGSKKTGGNQCTSSRTLCLKDLLVWVRLRTICVVVNWFFRSWTKQNTCKENKFMYIYTLHTTFYIHIWNL